MKKKPNIAYAEILDRAIRIEKELLQWDIDHLPVAESVKSYMRFNLKKLRYVSECNAFILLKILSNLPNHPGENIQIIDHGGGIGLFSFLVKSLGFGAIYHDLNREYAEGAQRIGQLLGLCPDHCIVGDTEDMILYCRQNQIVVSGLGSRNVIEHIVDFVAFFKELRNLAQPPCAFVFTTSANVHNPLVRKLHRAIHGKYEREGPKQDMDIEQYDPSKSGIHVRLDWIKRTYPALDEPTALHLAKLGRGYTMPEYKKLCDQFLETNIYPMPFPEKSNTRDFYTGVWVERLVSVGDYKRAAQAAGFQFSSESGFYSTHYPSQWMNFAARILNGILKYWPFGKLWLSPFLCLKLSLK